MKRQIVLINFCMLMGITLMAIRFISVWDSFGASNSLEQIVDRTRDRNTASLDIEPMNSSPLFSDFMVISERNLFAEDRRPPVVEEEVEVEIVEEERPNMNDPIVLHGVKTIDGKRQAIVTDGTQLRTVGLGELIQGHSVNEIGPSTIKLKWKDHEVLIDMGSAHQSMPAEASKVNVAAAVTVVTVGTAPAMVQNAGGTTEEQKGTGLQVLTAGGQSDGRQVEQANQGEQRFPGGQ
ncbi:MAG: hypothetical protein VYA53_02395 [Acidobacteriota bacterium]|nr:hypothetical protein [Acidobacteriota bacterium]